MLNKHELPLPRDEIEKVDTLRYSWSKLQALASEVSGHLLKIQPEFRGGLIENVQTFVEDCQNFYNDYDKVGPMVPGVAPRDASDRLIIFQNTFDTLYRKYQTYSGGEELFGLSVTPHPQLLQIKKELALLQVRIHNTWDFCAYISETEGGSWVHPLHVASDVNQTSLFLRSL